MEREMQTLQDENKYLKQLLANPDKAHKDEIYKLKAEIDQLKKEKELFKSHREIAEEETRKFMKKYRKEKKKNKKIEKEMTTQIQKEFQEKLKILGMSADIVDNKPPKNESIETVIESDEETIEMTPMPPTPKKILKKRKSIILA